MVADYLDKNYDRVSLHSSRRSQILIVVPVLLDLHDPHTVRELCHEAAITQAPGGDPAGQGQLHRHDEIHRGRDELEDDDEPPPRQKQEHSV